MYSIHLMGSEDSGAMYLTRSMLLLRCKEGESMCWYTSKFYDSTIS